MEWIRGSWSLDWRGSRTEALVEMNSTFWSQSTHPLWTEDRNEPLLSRPSFGFPIIQAEIHVRTETCLEYHLVLILDNIQDYAGRANKSFHCSSGHGSTWTAAAFQSEPWRGKRRREQLNLGKGQSPLALCFWICFQALEFLSRIGELPHHL